jgi:hypothetical protein
MPLEERRSAVHSEAACPAAGPEAACPAARSEVALPAVHSEAACLAAPFPVAWACRGA